MARKIAGDYKDLTEEDVSSKKVVPGDLLLAKQTLTSDKNVVVFQAGKHYPVLDYFPQMTGGLKVQSDVGPWTLTFQPNTGWGPNFSLEEMSSEERAYKQLENFHNQHLPYLVELRRTPYLEPSLEKRMTSIYGETPAFWTSLFRTLLACGLVEKYQGKNYNQWIRITPQGQQVLDEHYARR